MNKELDEYTKYLIDNDEIEYVGEEPISENIKGKLDSNTTDDEVVRVGIII